MAKTQFLKSRDCKSDADSSAITLNVYHEKVKNSNTSLDTYLNLLSGWLIKYMSGETDQDNFFLDLTWVDPRDSGWLLRFNEKRWNM